jgi:hypothetical protein
LAKPLRTQKEERGGRRVRVAAVAAVQRRREKRKSGA